MVSNMSNCFKVNMSEIEVNPVSSFRFIQLLPQEYGWHQDGKKSSGDYLKLHRY